MSNQYPSQQLQGTTVWLHILHMNLKATSEHMSQFLSGCEGNLPSSPMIQQPQTAVGYSSLPNPGFTHQNFNQSQGHYAYPYASRPIHTPAQPPQLIPPLAWLVTPSFPPLSDLTSSTNVRSMTGGEPSALPYQQTVDIKQPAVSSASSMNTHGQSIFCGASTLLKSSQSTQCTKSNQGMKGKQRQVSAIEQADPNIAVNRSNSTPNSAKHIFTPGVPQKGGDILLPGFSQPEVGDTLEDLLNDKRFILTAMNIYGLGLVLSNEMFLINTMREEGSGDMRNQQHRLNVINQAAVCLCYSHKCRGDGTANLHTLKHS
jgi:hypothetical protein